MEQRIPPKFPLQYFNPTIRQSLVSKNQKAVLFLDTAATAEALQLQYMPCGKVFLFPGKSLIRAARKSCFVLQHMCFLCLFYQVSEKSRSESTTNLISPDKTSTVDLRKSKTEAEKVFPLQRTFN